MKSPFADFLFFVSCCISGCHLYLRSDHPEAADCILATHTHAHKGRIRIFSTARFQIFRFDWESSEVSLNTCFCCRLYCCYSCFLSFVFFKEEKTCYLKARFLWIQCCTLWSTCSRGRAERTHKCTYGGTHSPSSSGSYTVCGQILCIIMKLGVVSFRSKWECFVCSL